jgi:ATP-dependent Clp protease ATP-binding subunit ClpA
MAIDTVVGAVQMFEARLSPEGRPAGTFLLLGPTGTGKTKTAEALARELHGDEKSLVRIDCGEFQMEHEVARLIGAPPGYLGHRETHPLISQQKLEAATSRGCTLSIVLFDEIEKAAPSMCRLLLGVLDKATLHLGDNTAVNFENSLIFLTSNLGADRIYRQIGPGFGFDGAAGIAGPTLVRKLEKIAASAVRKHFSPEFINRIDATLTYGPLNEESLRRILDQHIEDLRSHLRRRLQGSAFEIRICKESREFLLQRGTSAAYGARELKRTIHRNLTQQLAARAARGEIPPGSLVEVCTDISYRGLTIVVRPPEQEWRLTA